MKLKQGTQFTTVETATIAKVDPWGAEHRWQVSWLPEVTWGADPARDNVGSPQIAWGRGECPVRAERDSTGGFDLKPNFRTVNGVVFEPREVESLDELAPGCFCVESDA